MRIRWAVPAADDLGSIKAYLQQHYPQFAEATHIMAHQIGVHVFAELNTSKQD